MGFESERAAGVDHDAEHGDRYERRAVAYVGPDPGSCGGHSGPGLCGGCRRALRLHRPHGAPLRLRPAEAPRQGRGAALPGAGQRLFPPTNRPAG